MRFSSLLSCAALALASCSNGLNILMSNDDGFGSGNLRELYKMLRADGHNVYIVAPATQQSSQGGRSVFTDEPMLTTNSIYDLVKAGAPSLGTDPIDTHIWYYNGTPAACVFVGLDYVLPNFADFSVPDLVVTGPNFGTNLGPFVWTLSGTAGAAYAATGRGIPAIALSGSNNAVPYFAVRNESSPAYQVASVAYRVVQSIINSVPISVLKRDVGETRTILPLGYGLNVNIPPLFADNYTTIPVVHTRMTGDADTNKAVPNPDIPGTFTWANIEPLAPGVNACINGNCTLPGETYVVNTLGLVSLSLYTVDYTAPESEETEEVVQWFTHGNVFTTSVKAPLIYKHSRRFTA
ncbi:acid phosphatase precursor [Rhypophila sp. PSN 637]